MPNYYKLRNMKTNAAVYCTEKPNIPPTYYNLIHIESFLFDLVFPEKFFNLQFTVRRNFWFGNPDALLTH